MQRAASSEHISPHGHEEEGHAAGHPTPVASWSGEDITADTIQRTVTISSAYWVALAVLGVLFALGIVGVILRIAGGTAPQEWGYYSATVMFLLITAGAAPMLSIAPRLVRSHWRRTASRAAELWGVANLVGLLAFIPLLWVTPSLVNRQSIWGVLPVVSTLPADANWVERLMFNLFSQLPPGAPHVWDTVAYVALFLAGVGLLISGAIPDFAAARDRAPDGARKGIWRALSFNFHGHPRQWAVVRKLQVLFGAFYFPMLVWTISILGMDMLESYVPHWKDPVLPAQLALIGIQCGIAAAVLGFWFLRRNGWGEYLGRDQFWAPGKLMLAATLLWFYFWWSQFIVFWYGRMPFEKALLLLIMFGPILPVFIGAFLFSFVIPFLTIVWNPVRRSINGPALTALFILIGGFLNMLRYFVPSMQTFIPEYMLTEAHLPDPLPPIAPPDIADIFVMVGLPAGAIFLFMIGTKLVPIMNMWEIRELQTVRRVKTFLQTKVLVLGKPE